MFWKKHIAFVHICVFVEVSRHLFSCKYLVFSLLGECSILWSCFLNMGLAICSSYEDYLAKSNSVGNLGVTKDYRLEGIAET